MFFTNIFIFPKRKLCPSKKWFSRIIIYTIGRHWYECVVAELLFWGFVYLTMIRQENNIYLTNVISTTVHGFWRIHRCNYHWNRSITFEGHLESFRKMFIILLYSPRLPQMKKKTVASTGYILVGQPVRSRRRSRLWLGSLEEIYINSIKDEPPPASLKARCPARHVCTYTRTKADWDAYVIPRIRDGVIATLPKGWGEYTQFDPHVVWHTQWSARTFKTYVYRWARYLEGEQEMNASR